MLRVRLVQNYYELHGSFTDIQFTAIGELITQVAKENGVPLEELCYTLLGYKPCDNVTATQMCAVRTLALKGHEPSIQIIKSVDSDFNENILDIPDTNFGDNQIVFDLCYRYYLDCYCGEVPYKKEFVEFSRSINLLRTDTKCLNKVFKHMKDTNTSLVYQKSDKNEYAVTGNVVKTPLDVSVRDFTKISKKALECALFGKSANLSFITPSIVDDLPYISITRPQVYRQLLDIANAVGKTYKELLAEIGVNVIDQIATYDKLGFAVICKESNDLYLAIDTTSTVEDPFKRKVVY